MGLLGARHRWRQLFPVEWGCTWGWHLALTGGANSAVMQSWQGQLQQFQKEQL